MFVCIERDADDFVRYGLYVTRKQARLRSKLLFRWSHITIKSNRKGERTRHECGGGKLAYTYMWRCTTISRSDKLKPSRPNQDNTS
jgi:hypothetical protein